MDQATQAMILGGLFVLLGAICGGSFGLPSKYAKKDTPWEVLWGPFFFFVTILIPCTVAPLVVNDLGGIYAGVDLWTVIVPTLIFGFLWGLGSMTLGMSFAFIGLSLAYALNYGAQIIFGSLMPMAILDADQFLTSHGIVVLAGVAICLVGVVVAGRAGILKDRSVKKDSEESETAETESAVKKPKILIGLTLAAVSGVLCACYAVSFRYGMPILEEATKTVEVVENAGAVENTGAAENAEAAEDKAAEAEPVEAPEDESGGETSTQPVAAEKDAEEEGIPKNPHWAASWALTAMILWGGAFSACGYCLIQLTMNKTWGHLFRPGVGRVLLLAAAMAVLHDAAIFLFGLGCLSLGHTLAVSVGYPVFMSFAIIVGNVHGFRTGEWKGASFQSIAWIVGGIAILILGVCVLGLANWMTTL